MRIETAWALRECRGGNRFKMLEYNKLRQTQYSLNMAEARLFLTRKQAREHKEIGEVVTKIKLTLEN